MGLPEKQNINKPMFTRIQLASAECHILLQGNKSMFKHIEMVKNFIVQFSPYQSVVMCLTLP